MSGKLDQSLDQILGDRKISGPRRGRGRRVANASRVTKAAPTAGIQKNKAKKDATISTFTNTAASKSGATKIIVSNLPSDVSEAQIKVCVTSGQQQFERFLRYPFDFGLCDMTSPLTD